MGINSRTHSLLMQHLHLPVAKARLVLLGQLFMREGFRAERRRAVFFYRDQGFKRVVDIDINGKAEFTWDLNVPVPRKLRGKFDVLVNGGTGEHVHNQEAFWRNCDMLTAPRALMIHVGPEPGGFDDHSDHYHSIELYNQVAQQFGYAVLAELRHQHRRGWACYTAWSKQ